MSWLQDECKFQTHCVYTGLKSLSFSFSILRMRALIFTRFCYVVTYNIDIISLASSCIFPCYLIKITSNSLEFPNLADIALFNAYLLYYDLIIYIVLFFEVHLLQNAARDANSFFFYYE